MHPITMFWETCNNLKKPLKGHVCFVLFVCYSIWWFLAEIFFARNHAPQKVLSGAPEKVSCAHQLVSSDATRYCNKKKKSIKSPYVPLGGSV